MSRSPLAALAFALLLGGLSTAGTPAAPERSIVAANDNRMPAGVLANGALNVSIDAKTGFWSPDGPGKPEIPIEAFGETGKPLQVPGPLVRVPLGTLVVARVRNSIPGTVLAIHGMSDRPAVQDRIVRIPFGQERELRFRAGAPGTYYYWGSTTGIPLAARFGRDSQLVGAIVVDAPGQRESASDRVFVFSEWVDVNDAKGNTDFSYVVLAINGRRYPATERLSYVRGTHVRWHIVNASAEDHPLHLHGFYFNVESHGDGTHDLVYANADRALGVTELVPSGSTAVLSFKASRVGKWMFHCHIAYHIIAYLPLTSRAALSQPSFTEFSHMTNMGGMILRFTVVPKPGDVPVAAPPVARRLGLLVQPAPDDSAKTPSFQYVLQENGASTRGPGVLGPTIVLTKNEMTGITIVNHLDEPTAVHWHGIEQREAYYDGVAGYSGYGKRIEPTIRPGGSFEAKFAATRSGTFIYHTHMNDIWQLRGGLSGPLIVLPKGTRFDPATDHVIQVTSTQDPEDDRWIYVNGTKKPVPMTIAAGRTHRLRFINTTVFVPDLLVELASPNGTATWVPIARDGADLPRSKRVPSTAIGQVTIGQTRDYFFTPSAPGEYRLLFWRYNGDKLRATLVLHVVSEQTALERLPGHK